MNNPARLTTPKGKTMNPEHITTTELIAMLQEFERTHGVLPVTVGRIFISRLRRHENGQYAEIIVPTSNPPKK